MTLHPTHIFLIPTIVDTLHEVDYAFFMNQALQTVLMTLFVHLGILRPVEVSLEISK